MANSSQVTSRYLSRLAGGLDLETSVPNDVAEFIRECIDRLETLDVLLLLQSSEDRAWTVQQISDEMRSSPFAVQSSLEVLVLRGLVTAVPAGYRFLPRTPELAQKTRGLSACYRERRAAVITVIFSGPGDAVRSFAEAFRLKKGPSDG
jgi:hypothetical protein